MIFNNADKKFFSESLVRQIHDQNIHHYYSIFMWTSFPKSLLIKIKLLCFWGPRNVIFSKIDTCFWVKRTYWLLLDKKKLLSKKWVQKKCIWCVFMGITKKWCKSTKIWGTFKLQYLKLETGFWQTFKGYNQLLDMDILHMVCVQKATQLKRNGSKKCAYGVCSNKWHGNYKKTRQKYQKAFTIVSRIP